MFEDSEYGGAQKRTERERQTDRQTDRQTERAEQSDLQVATNSEGRDGQRQVLVVRVTVDGGGL